MYIQVSTGEPKAEDRYVQKIIKFQQNEENYAEFFKRLYQNFPIATCIFTFFQQPLKHYSRKKLHWNKVKRSALKQLWIQPPQCDEMNSNWLLFYKSSEWIFKRSWVINAYCYAI